MEEYLGSIGTKYPLPDVTDSSFPYLENVPKMTSSVV
jgi:hypothetical protein